MNKTDLRLAKKKILKCLTEDVEYGINKQTGKPLKRRKVSKALFDKKEGWAIWSQTDLEMVMDKVVLGLYFALEDSNAAPNNRIFIEIGDTVKNCQGLQGRVEQVNGDRCLVQYAVRRVWEPVSLLLIAAKAV